MRKIPSVLSLFLLSFLLNSFLTGNSLHPEKNEGKEKLNLLLITIDTLRPDRLSCYSNKHIQTPNIDSLAEKGTLFLKAFAHTTTTLPSHVNILLGTTPLYHGVHENASFIVKEEFLTLAEHLKSHGYVTGAFVGAYPLDSRFGLDQGFDIYDDEYSTRNPQEYGLKERKAEAVVASALNWLKNQASPWFLWIHCFDPHDPYEPPEPFRTRYANQLYDGEVSYVDYALGSLFDSMKENHLYDNTLVIFTGDHGESLAEHGEMTHGYFAYNSTLWIPLIIYIPGLKPGKIDQQVTHIDIFPTACDVLKIEKPPFLQGVSLLPSIKGKKLPERPIYFESLYPYYSRGWAPLRGFILGKEKFIESPLPEFYDLEKDFDELKNIISEKNLNKYKEKLAGLIKNQSLAESSTAEQKIDRQSLEKLRSLGYISSPGVPKKEKYGPQDDVKIFLPYHNKSLEAANLYGSGKVKEALEVLKNIIAERNDVDIAYSTLAIIYKEQGRIDEALEVLKQGNEVLPSNYEILSKYINFLVEAGHFDDVIQIVRSSNLPQINNDPDTWNHLGISYMSKENLEEALAAFEEALSLDDQYPVIYKNLGNLYFSIFLKEKSSSAYQKSLENYKKAIELDSTYASAYNGLGAVYLQTAQNEEAIYCFTKAIELKPDYGPAVYNLGLAYLNSGKMNKAYEYLTLFKEKYSQLLPPPQLKILDSLIQKCKRGS